MSSSKNNLFLREAHFNNENKDKHAEDCNGLHPQILFGILCSLLNTLSKMKITAVDLLFISLHFVSSQQAIEAEIQDGATTSPAGTTKTLQRKLSESCDGPLPLVSVSCYDRRTSELSKEVDELLQGAGLATRPMFSAEHFLN